MAGNLLEHKNSLLSAQLKSEHGLSLAKADLTTAASEYMDRSYGCLAFDIALFLHIN
jgi:hypothetical protein